MFDNSVHNTDDVIDSRSIVERITELDEADELDEDETEELASLRELLDQLSDFGSQVEDGIALVRDSYFEDYARELAEELGAIPSDYSWPASHIDWEAAADALRIDYTTVDFDGTTYWAR